MENAKSVIDVEVNDDQFREFHRLFEQYKSALREMPGEWEDVACAEGKTSNITKDLTAALSAHVVLINQAADARAAYYANEERAHRHQIEYQKTIEAAERRQNSLIAKRQQYIKKIGSNLTSIMGKSTSIGLSIAKWGAGIGLAALGGGLFGMDRLGATATGERSTGRMLGVTSGQLRSWRTNFAQYGDPDSLLSAASNAATDPMMAARMQRAGVSDGAIRSGDTSQIAEQTLRGLAAFFNRNRGPNAQQIWSANGYDQIIGYNQMRQFAGASASEREAMFRNLRYDQQSMGNSDRTMREWSDFTTQLSRAKQQIKATFLDGLQGLTSPMSELSRSVQSVVKQFMSSGAFSDTIKAISQGMNDLASSLKDGTAQKAIHDFISALSEWTRNGSLTDDLKTIEAGIHKLAKLFSWIAPGDDTTPEGRSQQSNHRVFGSAALGATLGGGIGATLGSIIPGAGTLAGGVTGSMLGGALGTMLGGGYDIYAQTYHASTAAQQSPVFQMAKQNGVSDDMARYLASVAATESSGNPNAVSSAGAMGLMQLTGPTAKQYGVRNPFDPQQSIRGAAAYVGHLMQVFHGDMAKVTASYNAGEGSVSSAVAKYGEKNWLSHMPNETQQYVGRISANLRSGAVNININNTTGGAATVTARQAATP